MQHITSRQPTRRLSRWLAGALALGLGAGLAAVAGTPEAHATLPTGCVAQDVSLRVGDKAPMFPNPLPSSAGESAGAAKLDLQAALGKKNIVLAFYVADWTGG